MTKRFKIRTENLRDLTPNIKGACVASDRITVEGLPVGFMYREPPFDAGDTGWRLYAGDESDAFMADLSNFSVQLCNTIANHDPSIIPLLGAPTDSTFKRKDGRFEEIEPMLARWSRKPGL